MPVGSYRILPSDPHWPRMFAEEQLRIAEALHLAAVRIEHIGSTAVAGLGAKPIIDVMAGIDIPPTSARGGPLLDGLRATGYVIGGTETAPGTLYGRKAKPHRYNLHLTQYGNEFWTSRLAFRDYLRTHPVVAAEYEKMKRDILIRMGSEISQPAYNDAKAEFVQSVTRRALAERP
jgi:GrpB-like predicted nucleotidyltransferase (UPF0157 family)